MIYETKNLNQNSIEMANKHINNLTMPSWALGDLLDIGVKLSGIQGVFPPKVGQKRIYIFACDHGIVEENVSLFPKEVTEQMVRNFVSGGAAISVLSRHAGAETIIVDMGVDADLSDLAKKGDILDRKISMGTENFSKGPSMTLDQAEKSLKVGFELVKDSYNENDIYAIGEMGIGNTTTSTAIVSALLGSEVDLITGRGTGIDEKARLHKVDVIKESLQKRKIENDKSPLSVLQKVGSYEIGAMAGMILGCASFGRPVIIDGFISSTAALLAFKINPKVIDFMFLAHKSMEPGHRVIIEELGLSPLLDLNMRLGEGSGTPLAMNLLEASCKILSEMATFESAQVSRENEVQ